MYYSIIFSFVLSFKLFKIYSKNAPKKLLDIPNNRSMHTKPKPRGAGIIFVALTLVSTLIYILVFGVSRIYMITIILIPLSIIGLIDDLYNLPAITKYFIQFFTSILIFKSSNLFDSLNLNLLNYIIFSIFITIFITAIINFINFMDGLDGLVSSCMLISISTTCFVLGIDQNFLFLIGSLIAFIFWNWFPAKIFMGDIGSTFLAAINIGLILQSENYIEAFGLLMVLSPCIIDPLVCVIRRFYFGENIFSAHRLHIYQRLNSRGIRQDRVSILYISITLLLSLSNIFLDIKFTLIIFSIVLLIGLYLDKFIAISFEKALKASHNIQ